ncbi:MAG: DUF2203 domain-containing protein [Micromonosporaceae bacterium]|jgi:hypothetical protein|nr:DUF2203 domain-containing protein [Micromonosporaceae bacterium]
MSSVDAPLSLTQARTLLAALRPRIDTLIRLRADLAELRADLAGEAASPLGGRAEAKALEARLYAVMEELGTRGTQVKGYAPLLLDWPGELYGRPVLWCWLEGDPDVGWYHRVECGFAGRRPVPDDLT